MRILHGRTLWHVGKNNESFCPPSVRDVSKLIAVINEANHVKKPMNTVSSTEQQTSAYMQQT